MIYLIICCRAIILSVPYNIQNYYIWQNKAQFPNLHSGHILSNIFVAIKSVVELFWGICKLKFMSTIKFVLWNKNHM